MQSKYEIVTKMAYLIGVPEEHLKSHYTSVEPEIINELRKNKNATIIRCLCKLRTQLLLKFKSVDDKLKNTLGKNIDKMPEYFDTGDIRYLEENGCHIIKVNYRASSYMAGISSAINNYISEVEDIFPDWVNFSYIKDLFVIPKNSYISEFDKFMEGRLKYPFQMYIHWSAYDCGNILSTDGKFLKVLYSAHGEDFDNKSRYLDADDSTKDAIYDFVDNSNTVNIVVDCENVDPYKFYGVIQNLDAEKVKKVSKIVLWDDVRTSYAWKIFKDFVNIDVEYNEVERVVENKSLVDVKLIAGVCKDFYQNSIDSFILVSSDSDFWGLISSIDANFLVMYEHGKCSQFIKGTLNENNIFSCAIDDFCTGNANELKKKVLVGYLKENVGYIFDMSGYELAKKVYADNFIEGTDNELRLFYDKYIKTIKLSVTGNSKAKLIVKD